MYRFPELKRVAIIALLMYPYSCYCAELPIDRTSPISSHLPRQKLRLGEIELEHIVRDRPQMGKLVKKGDVVWEWASRQLAGECTGRLYKWNASVITNGNGLAYHDHKARWITLKKTKNDVAIEGDILWAALIFELFNIRNDREFDTIWSSAIQEKTSKPEFVSQITKLEYYSLQELSVFYKTIWKRHMENLGIKTNRSYWYADLPATYEEWISKHHEINSPYLEYCGKIFDSITQKSDAQNNKAPRRDEGFFDWTDGAGDFLVPSGKPLNLEGTEDLSRSLFGDMNGECERAIRIHDSVS